MHFRSFRWSLVAIAAFLLPCPVLAGSTSGISFTLRWTAPGDDGMLGTATSYDVRYAHFLINQYNFNLATKVTTVPTPGAPGTSQSCTISSLPVGTYYFAIRTVDEKGNWSKVSNLGFYDGTAVTAVGESDLVSFSSPLPNPAHGQAHFTLELPFTEAVKIEAFDASGRRVRTLLQGEQPAGSQDVVFDLHDQFGRPLRSGIYLVRAQVGPRQFMRRVVAIG